MHVHCVCVIVQVLVQQCHHIIEWGHVSIKFDHTVSGEYICMMDLAVICECGMCACGHDGTLDVSDGLHVRVYVCVCCEHH